MAESFLRRILHALVTLLVASALVWSLQGLAPGDPARRVLAANGVTHPNDVQVQAERQRLGLDGHPLSRYRRWLTDAVRGDLGRSWVTGRPVARELTRRLPATLILTAVALALALVLALTMALLAAAFPARWPDTLMRGLSLGALVTPSFLVGSVLLHVVVLRWGLARVIADGSLVNSVLPALTLALGPAALWARVLRAGLLDAHTLGHVEVGRARGVGRVRMLLVHDLPNALVPFLAVFAAGAAALLGGAPIVETVFTWPGIGRFTIAAITSRDLPVVQGFTLFAVAAFVVTTTAADLFAMTVDPRTRPPARARRRRAAVVS